MNKILAIIFSIILLFQNTAYSKHLYKESVYQQAWANKNNGICEYKNDDGTRVDCITKTHAIEFDFAEKWAEAIGQALYYKHKTGKRAMVILILENKKKQMVYFNRVKTLSKIYDFDAEYITPANIESTNKITTR